MAPGNISTVILSVLSPDTILKLAGKFQAYFVAPFIDNTEKTLLVVPSQTLAGPEIVPAFSGSGHSV